MMPFRERFHRAQHAAYPAAGLDLDQLAVERLHLAPRVRTAGDVEWYDLEGKLRGVSRATNFPPAFSHRLDLVVQLIEDRAWSVTNYHEDRCQLRRDLCGLERAYFAQVGMFSAEASTDAAAALIALLRQVDYEMSSTATFEEVPHAR